MAKAKVIYTCTACGCQTSRWLGKCPDCDSWNSFEEEVKQAALAKGPLVGDLATASTPSRLFEIDNTNDERLKTGSLELDRVLSGGVVKGSLVLISGDPGIGKSTLLLQICGYIGEKGIDILYVSGEESAIQLKMRADRLGIHTNRLWILSQTNIEAIEEAIIKYQPGLVIIDSIQTMYTSKATQAPGSVTQVRESTTALMRIGKGKGIAIIIVGHATKEGSIAGPRLLEHMVDTVLYFEGERYLSYRILRAVKNRFGSTNEIGVFEMNEKGLEDILNPSEYLLSGRPQNVSGSVLTTVMEGSRAIITEVQALVSPTNFSMPRRSATGVDLNRLYLIIAVLEKKLGLNLAQSDIYINVAGGMKVIEPSLDAAIAMAIFSSFRNVALRSDAVVFGELGLSGEIRAVSLAEKRVSEASKMGYKYCIIPSNNYAALKKSDVFGRMGASAAGISNVAGLADKLG